MILPKFHIARSTFYKLMHVLFRFLRKVAGQSDFSTPSPSQKKYLFPSTKYYISLLILKVVLSGTQSCFRLEKKAGKRLQARVTKDTFHHTVSNSNNEAYFSGIFTRFSE